MSQQVCDAQQEQVAVLGAGVIGVSWAALFAAHGCRIALYDIDPLAFTAAEQQLELIRPTLLSLGLAPDSRAPGSDGAIFYCCPAPDH